MDTVALIIPTAVLVCLTFAVSLSLVFYRFYLVRKDLLVATNINIYCFKR